LSLSKWKIKDKNGNHVLSVEPNGRVWKSDPDRRKSTWFEIAYIKHGVCNVFTVYTLGNSEDKVPVYLDIFNYRRKLKIKKLRRQFTETESSYNGDILKVSYGYIDRNSMRNLIESRKIKKDAEGKKFIITKRKDWDFYHK